MSVLSIRGGVPLTGRVRVSGAKNVALKVVAAGLYTDEPIVLHNMPRIQDVENMLEILRSLGAETSFIDHTVAVRTRHISSTMISLEMGAKCKTGTLAFGPLLNLTGEAIIPNPGGCRIGKRPIDRYIQGLEALGAHIRYEDGYFKATAPSGLRGNVFRFVKNSHTGTEALILAAVCAKGKTVIENAAAEPEVDDLIALLNAMGGRIRRSDERTIIVEGVNFLHGAEYSIIGDRLEAVTFACAALATDGDIVIEGIDWALLSAFLEQVDLAGREYTILPDGIRFFGTAPIKPTSVVTSIHPGFITDWQQPWCVVMTRANGVSMIHETIFEYRFAYISELEKMGGKFELFRPVVADPDLVYNFNLADDKPENPHAVKIFGPVVLHGADVTVSDLRAGATLVIAALAAQGVSTVSGIHHIERGYEKFVERMQSLGAQITVLPHASLCFMLVLFMQYFFF